MPLDLLVALLAMTIQHLFVCVGHLRAKRKQRYVQRLRMIHNRGQTRAIHYGIHTRIWQSQSSKLLLIALLLLIAEPEQQAWCVAQSHEGDRLRTAYARAEWRGRHAPWQVDVRIVAFLFLGAGRGGETSDGTFFLHSGHAMYQRARLSVDTCVK